jgi:hypothetical protein
MRSLFSLCAFTYLVIYAFEGVIRYGLYNVGLDNAILLRDGLVIGPTVILLAAQAFRLHIHPAYGIFAAIITLHGAMAYFNLGTAVPAIYGTKLLINVLFGFIAARQLTQPGRGVLWLLGLIWLASMVGVVLDKYVYTMPWMGMETHIGGIAVDVSRGWDIDSGFEKRAAGFSRSSISAAMLLPTLALIIAPRLRSWLLRAVMLALTVGAVLLTTQKGALVAIAAVSVILCAPAWSRYRLLALACLAFALLDVALPLVTAGMLVPDTGGVFSFSSFGMRIMLTWPEAWHWILHNEVFPFGVGLGGIGGAQRFYAPNSFNPSDNFFVFLYANFGLMSLVYLGWAACQGLRVPADFRSGNVRSGDTHSGAIVALGLLAFNFGYGAALSMLEDQMSALFIGAAVGMLWQLRQAALGGPWQDPYGGSEVPSVEPATTVILPHGGSPAAAQ